MAWTVTFLAGPVPGFITVIWKLTCSPFRTRPGEEVASTLSLGSWTIVLALEPVLAVTVAACSQALVEVATTLRTTDPLASLAASIGLGQW